MRWPVVTLESLQVDEPRAITDGPFGSNLARKHYTSSGPRVVRLQNIGDGEFIDSRAHISEAHFEALRNHDVRPGDLLVASLGEVLPRACLAPSWLGPAIVKADCIRVRLNHRADPRWVLHSLQSPGTRQWADEHRHGVGRPRLGLKVIRQIPVPLPPLDEQRRIVEILEDHLSRLDVAERSLIGSLRKARRMSTASLGEQLSRPRGDAWRDCTVGGEALLVEYGSSAKTGPPSQTTDIPVLRMGNIKDGAIDWTSLKYLPQGHSDFPKLLLQPGDLLFNRTNSAEHVGKSAVFDEATVSSFASYLIRVRLGNDVDPRWANMVINSPQGRRYVGSVVSQQVGQANVNGTKLKAFPLPVPPIDQQLRRIAAHKGVVDAAARLNREVSAARIRADALRAALLAAAFSGRLTGHASDAGLIEEMAGV